MNILSIYGLLTLDGVDPNNPRGLQVKNDEYIDTWVHDAGCAIIKDGILMSAILEERLTRIKSEGRFPNLSIGYVLKDANLNYDDIDLVVMPSCPVSHFYKYMCEGFIHKHIKNMFPNATLHFLDHHLCHAASSVLTSNFEEAEFFVTDGSGSLFHSESYELIQYIVSSLGLYLKDKKIFRIYDGGPCQNANNFGIFYAELSRLLLFYKYEDSSKSFSKNIERETASGKIMGLSAYGETKRTKNYLNDSFKQLKRYLENKTLSFNVFAKTKHGNIGLQSIYNNFYRPGITSFLNVDNIQQDAIDFSDSSIEESAYLLQGVFEIGMFALINLLKKSEHLQRNVCFSGGSFLNVLSNTRIRKSNLFENIHIPPYTSDSGMAIGAALFACFKWDRMPIMPKNIALLGRKYSELEILQSLQNSNLQYIRFDNFKQLCDEVSHLLNKNKIVAWFQGRSESGPRALGSRSILMNPKPAENKDILNFRVKHREYWRPYAGAILEEYLTEYFEEDFDSPYMLYSYTTKPNKREFIQAINHVDDTCRVQTLNKELYPEFYELVDSFHKISGVPIVLNTSFNDNGEPIVETPEQAFKSFIKMDIDALAIGNFLITKRIENECYNQNYV